MPSEMQAFSFETGHYCPVYQESVGAISGTPIAAKQQTFIALLFSYITANGPSMARLRNAARAISDPPGICK